MEIQRLLKEINEIVLFESDTLLTAIKMMNTTGEEIIIAIDADGKLAGVLSIGDVLRAIIKNKSYDEHIKDQINISPIIVKSDVTIGEVNRIFKKHKIKYLPVIDSEKNYLGLILANDLDNKNIIDCPVVIMAGGLGTRLRPLTNDIPKPLLPLYDKPIIQHIIENFRKYGVHQFFVSVNYKKEKIKQFLDNGDWLRVSIDFIEENKKLGTAGSLGNRNFSNYDHVIVINGDVITNLNFQMMYDFHRSNDNDITIAIKNFEVNVPYGILQMDFNKVTNIIEKPTLVEYINAGIYIIKAKNLKKIKKDSYLDMPDYIKGLLNEKKRVFAYPIEDDWVDLGTYDEYVKINKR